MARQPRFLLGEFAEPESMIASARNLREQGWPVEIHTPFPVDGMAEALGFDEQTVPLAVLLGGIAGAAIGFGVQAWVNLAYPLDVGGRMLVTVPAFAFTTIVLALLFAGLTGVATFFVKCRLPRLHHPLFDAERFHLASDNRFFVAIALDGRDANDAGRAMAMCDPLSTVEVGGDQA